jgi:hypothetical protein
MGMRNAIHTQENKLAAPEQIINMKISREQLRKAYEVSPTLQKAQPFIDAQLHRRIVRIVGDIPDTSKVEVKVDFIMWSLLEGTRDYIESNPDVIKDVSKNASYPLFVAMDKELQEAFKSNIIQNKKKEISPSLASIQETIKSLKSSLELNIKYLLFPSYARTNTLDIVDDPRVTKEMAEIFNKTANRRIDLLGRKNTRLMQYLNRSSIIIHVLNVLGLIFFAILFILYFQGKANTPLLRRYVFIVAFILCLTIARLVLYTLVDSYFFSTVPRYLFSSMPLFSALSLLNTYVVLRLIIRTKSKQKLEHLTSNTPNHRT